MNYRNDKYNNPVSVLGFGCMRFTQNMGRIDIDKAEKEIMTAVKLGVNYFDTAYIYPGSEAALGEIIKRNGIRDKIYIATKLPHYLIKSVAGAQKRFEEQLRRLKTDHIDYYLMHMLTDEGTWESLVKLGIKDWLEEKKKSGQIRQIGFSYHGNSENFCRLVDAYDWDFCQIQYNYFDENSQAGRRGLNYASEHGLPVIIMEPLRGGKLVNRLPSAALKIFGDYPVGRTPAEWAFKWLWDQPEVTCVLSGMNSEEMVKNNASSASSSYPGELTDADRDMLARVIKAINSGVKVGCTGCGYCMPCPMNVDIPGTFAAYNLKYSEGTFSALREYFMCTAMRKTATSASNCIKCGKCQQHCPQNISIPKELKKAVKELEGPLYKTGKRLVKLLKAYK